VALGRIWPWYAPAWFCSLLFPALIWVGVSEPHEVAEWWLVAGGWWLVSYALALVLYYAGTPYATEKWQDALLAFFIPWCIASAWLFAWRIFG
jgi:hypothetical protein